jgi:hypothetical protein
MVHKVSSLSQWKLAFSSPADRLQFLVFRSRKLGQLFGEANSHVKAT